MNYGAYDSSDTDDDLPPHQDRFSGVRQSYGNGGPASVPRKHDMETQIHNIELEAYSSVLRAFQAQSDAITWGKEKLITELRKELRISDEENRELLSKVNTDEIIQMIRMWRKRMTGDLPLHEPRPSSTHPEPNKKLKTSLSMGAPSPAVRSTLDPSPSILKRGSYSGDKINKTKSSSSQDTRRDGETFEVSGKGARLGTGRGIKRCMSRDGAGGRGTTNGQSKQEFPTSLNGNVKKGSAGIEIMHTSTLIKKVQKICNANHDPKGVEKAMSLLKDHEQTLIEAIRKLEELSDNEND